MSVTVELRVIDHGDDDYMEAAWELKEHVRTVDGVLRQRRPFFCRAYRRARVHALILPPEKLVAFAATRSDGYLLFLAVDPDYRREGFGHRLITELREEHQSISCHTRTTNDQALAFYRDLGFEVCRRIDNYYEDGGDAYYLRLGDPSRIRDRIRKYIPE